MFFRNLTLAQTRVLVKLRWNQYSWYTSACYTDQYVTWPDWVLRTLCMCQYMNMPSTAHQNPCDRVTLCVTFMRRSACYGPLSGIIWSRRYLCLWQVVSK